jgi:hypothetical protein
VTRASLLVLAALLVVSPARASGDDDLQRATVAYAEGMDLRVAGHPEASLEKLRLAHQLYPTAITGLELGRAYMLLGRLLEARDALLSVARIGPRANESARANNARAEAAGLGVELGDRIPRLVFQHAGPAPTVTVDGANVGNLDEPYRVNPGEHAVAWGGTERRVTLVESQALTVALTSTDRAAPVPLASPAAPETSSRTMFWTALTLTGIAAATGTVAGIVAIGDANTARSSCPLGQCEPSVHGAADGARTWSTVSTVSFVGAGIFGAATVVAYLLTGHASKDPPRIGSLSLSF